MKRLLPLLIILVLLISLFTIGAAAEDDFLGNYTMDLVAYVVSMVGVILLGIITPLIPIIRSVVELFSRKTEHPIPYYVMFIAGAIWFLLGVIILILLLI